MKTKDFSLLLPTHNHPGLMRRLFDSLAKTTANLDNLEIILYLDHDDLDSQAVEHPLLSMTKLLKYPDTMGNILRTSYAASGGKYVMLINDDMIFGTKNWDLKVLKAFSRFSDDVAMVFGNDLYYGQMMCTFPILSRIACELMDKICPAQYKWHCIDAQILDVFKRLEKLGHKRAVYLGNVVFEHMHHELSAAINDSAVKPESDAYDQNLYFSLADQRQELALKMAEYINSKVLKVE